MASEYDDRVRERAYHLWQESGGEHGKEMEHWLTAEREVSGATSKGGKPASGKTSAGTAADAAGKASSSADRTSAPKAAAKAGSPSATVKASAKAEPPKSAPAKPAASGKGAVAAKTAKHRSGKSPA